MSIAEQTPTERIVEPTERRLHLDEVDAFGIVFYARYREWYLHAFEAFLRELGTPAGGACSSRATASWSLCRHRLPHDAAAWPDRGCEMWAATVGERSVTMNARFGNEAGAELTRAKTVHVADGSPGTVPDWLREAVATLAAPTAS